MKFYESKLHIHSFPLIFLCDCLINTSNVHTGSRIIDFTCPAFHPSSLESIVAKYKFYESSNLSEFGYCCYPKVGIPVAMEKLQNQYLINTLMLI